MKQSIAIKALSKHYGKNSLTILNSVVVNNNKISMYDLESRATLYTDSDLINDKTVLVPIAQLASASTIGVCTLTDNSIVVAGKHLTYAPMPLSDYPDMCTPTGDNPTIEIDRAQLLNAITNVAYAIAKQDVRYYLNGILFDFLGDRLNLVATDGHRLALTNCHVGTHPVGQYIVPSATIKILSGVLKLSTTPTVKLTFGDNYMATVSGDDFSITTKLTDGKYPDYNRVIPKNNNELLRLDVAQTLKTLKQLKPFLNKRYQGLLIDIAAKEFEASNPESSMRLPMPILDHSEAIEKIGIRATYLVDCLNRITTATVDFMLADANSALYAISDNVNHVLMPMRL